MSNKEAEKIKEENKIIEDSSSISELALTINTIIAAFEFTFSFKCLYPSMMLGCIITYLTGGITTGLFMIIMGGLGVFGLKHTGKLTKLKEKFYPKMVNLKDSTLRKIPTLEEVKTFLIAKVRKTKEQLPAKITNTTKQLETKVESFKENNLDPFITKRMFICRIKGDIGKILLDKYFGCEEDVLSLRSLIEEFFESTETSEINIIPLSSSWYKRLLELEARIKNNYNSQLLHNENKMFIEEIDRLIENEISRTSIHEYNKGNDHLNFKRR